MQLMANPAIFAALAGDFTNVMRALRRMLHRRRKRTQFVEQLLGCR